MVKDAVYLQNPADHIFVHFEMRSILQGLQKSQNTGSVAGSFARTYYTSTTTLTILICWIFEFLSLHIHVCNLREILRVKLKVTSLSSQLLSSCCCSSSRAMPIKCSTCSNTETQTKSYHSAITCTACQMKTPTTLNDVNPFKLLQTLFPPFSLLTHTLCSMDSDQCPPLGSTAHCRTAPSMPSSTSHCRMFTRLANSGQNGGSTGGGKAAQQST